MARRLKELADFKTIRELIVNNYVEFPTNVAFVDQDPSSDSESPEFKEITYDTLYHDSEALGSYLTRRVRMGKNAGTAQDDVRIAIIGNNSYSYALTALTIASGIGVAVPLGRSIGKEELAKFFEENEINYVFTDFAGEGTIPPEIPVFSLEHDEFAGYMALGREDDEARTVFTTMQSNENDTCFALATNGKREKRKLARVTHKEIATYTKYMQKFLKLLDSDVFMSVLPLALYAEFMLGLLIPLSRGCSVIYCSNAKGSAPASMIRYFKPTVIVAVPSFVEDIYSSIWANIERNGNSDIAERFIRMVETAGPVRRGVKQNVFSEVTDALGGELKHLICTTDKLSYDAQAGMRAFGVPVLNVYGSAECPIIAVRSHNSDVRRAFDIRMPFVDVSVNFADYSGTGEIRIKGDGVSPGYLCDKHTKKYVSHSGWLSTRDLGTIEDGHIYLTGKKSTRIEIDGKYVYPEQLELSLTEEKSIAEALVYPMTVKDEEDNDRIILCAKIRPESSFIEVHGPNAAKKAAADAVARLNSILLDYKKILKFSVTFDLLPRTAAYRLKRD